MNEILLFSIIDTIGTIAFAMSGATAGMQRKLDFFGVLLLAFIAACGGGILRDIMIGATPPASIVTLHYFSLTFATAIFAILARSLINRLMQPVLFFDAIGLALFCVVGTQKAYLYTQSEVAAIFLGMVTAVGGGVLRDIVLNRIPLIMRKEIYALAALLGSAIVIVCQYLGLSAIGVWLGMLVCFGLRILSLRYQWHLPRFSIDDTYESD